MKKSPIFEDTYLNYLEQLKSINYLSRASVLGAETEQNALVIPFYGDTYRISGDKGISSDSTKKVPFAIRVVLLKYILMAPESCLGMSEQKVTFREFRDAGPLTSFFTVNTNKIIESNFSGRLEHLKKQCRRMGGILNTGNPSYDLSVTFHALPRIPVYLNFNDSDEEFPAVCSILYRKSAEQYIDMESLSITGTYLAGSMIGRNESV